jgi:prepilin-type N-terminal cleavage/methylation domain-containing protein
MTLTKQRGFSLMEMMIGMAIGVVILGAAASLFKTGTDATSFVQQRGDMEEDTRAALNLIAKDASMAGSGLPSGGLTLPYGGASTGVSHFAVDQTGKSWLNNNNYISGTVEGVVLNNYMYGIIPGAGNGMEKGGPATIPATGTAADEATFIYVDYSFPLNQYTFTVNANGIEIDNVAPPVGAPAGFPAIQSPTGLVLGDLLLVSQNGNYAVVEITGINPGGTIITFAAGDALNMNQPGAASGNLKYLQQNGGGNTAIAYRIYAVTYFMEVPATFGELPRLMRQVNGQTPVPVADNIIAMNFTYDLCTATPVTGCAGQENPIAAGYSPNQIEKVNILLEGQSPTSYGNKSRSTALSTSVSTRNLTFKNRY